MIHIRKGPAPAYLARAEFGLVSCLIRRSRNSAEDPPEREMTELSEDLLTYHHRSEDREIFPLVRPVDEGVARVVDRLVAEHAVIEALLENLVTSAQALVVEQSTSAFEALRDTFSTLERVVRSHFAYEEVELEEAIGLAAVPFS